MLISKRGILNKSVSRSPKKNYSNKRVRKVTKENFESFHAIKRDVEELNA